MPINPGDVTTLASVVSALSVANERLVNIIQGIVPQFLEQPAPPPAGAPAPTQAQADAAKHQDTRRQAALHIIAAICGAITAWMASGTLPDAWPKTFLGYAGIGLLVSGGSGVWNSVLSYAKAAKDAKAS